MGFLLGGGSIAMAIWNAYLILPDDILRYFILARKLEWPQTRRKERDAEKTAKSASNGIQ